MKKKAFLAILSLFAFGAVGQTSNNFPPSGDANVGATEILNNSYASPLKPGLRSSGDRFLFYNNASYKTAIGMLNENGLYMQAQGAASTPLLQLWSGTDAGGDISAKYTFTVDGNLGIGTNNPGSRLSFPNVDGATEADGITWYSPTRTVYGIHRTAGSWTAPNYQQLRLGWETGIILDPGASYGKSYVDIQGDGLRVTSGNIGIGVVDTRGYKLAVNGKIRAQEIKVEASPWPDYVFTKDYQLPSLQQTEQHIKEKGHLPGIPSAAEVKANGIDLGEMNAKLLQKIEELTLHLIEKDKEIKRLENFNERIKELEMKIEKIINKP